MNILVSTQKGTKTPEELFRILKNASEINNFDFLRRYFHTPSSEAKASSFAVINMFKIAQRVSSFLKHGKLKFGENFYDVIDNCRADFKDCLSFGFDFKRTATEPIRIVSSFDATFAMGNVKHTNTYGEIEQSYFSLIKIDNRWFIYIPNEICELERATRHFIDQAEIAFIECESAKALLQRLETVWDDFK